MLTVRSVQMHVTSVTFNRDCAGQGCWILHALVTTAQSAEDGADVNNTFNTFFLPFYPRASIGMDVHVDYSVNQFPCLSANNTPVSSCCFGSVPENSTQVPRMERNLLNSYSTINTFAAWAEDMPCNATGQNAANHTLEFLAAGQQFSNLVNSPGIVRVDWVDSHLGQYNVVIALEEGELGDMAAAVAGFNNRIDFLLGHFSFDLNGTILVNPAVSQTDIRVQRSNVSVVSIFGAGAHSVLDVVNVRLISVYAASFSSNLGSEFLDFTDVESSEVDDDEHIDFVRVFFSPSQGSDGLSVISPVLAGRGTVFDDTVMEEMCAQWSDAASSEHAGTMQTFERLLAQSCAPEAFMCTVHQRFDRSVSFDIPLGVNYVQSPEDHSVFVQISLSAFSSGAQVLDATLLASVSIDNGVEGFCDALGSAVDLRQAVDADILVGLAANTNELSSLPGQRNSLAQNLYTLPIFHIAPDLDMSRLLTLVLKGRERYFTRNGRQNHELVLADVVTVHVMHTHPSSSLRRDDLVLERRLSSLFPTGSLEVDALPAASDELVLSRAFNLRLNRHQGRAYLEPSEELLALCPFNPPAPATESMQQEPCVVRRDVTNGEFGVGSSLTAAEICFNDGCGSGASTETEFLSDTFGSESPGSLVQDHVTALRQEHGLNGRFIRAYWVNPGYEWKHSATSRAPWFAISQKMYMFTLVALVEGGDQESLIGRRWLIPTARAFHSMTSRTELLASEFSVSEELVASFAVEMLLTERQACTPINELQQSLRDTLAWRLAQADTSSFHTVQVTTVARDLRGLQCGRCNSCDSLSNARAEFTMLVVFAENGRSGPTIHLGKLREALPSLLSVSELRVSNGINVISEGIVVPRGSESGEAEFEWFMEPALSNSYLYWILGTWGSILLCGCCAACAVPPEDRFKVFLTLKVIFYLLWFVFDFTFMCAKFDWFINSEDAVFEAYTTATGRYVWVGPHFFSASESHLAELGCNYTHNELTRAPDDVCQIWWVSFNGDLSMQGGSMSAGAQKFSIGFGLFLYIAIYFGIQMAFEQAIQEAEKDAVDGKMMIRFAGEICVFFAEVPIICQQSLVLMPLTGMHFSPACAVLNVPARSRDAMCMYKWAIAGLPYGILMLIGAGVAGGIAGALGQGGNVVAAILAFVAGVWALILAVTSVSMILFWAFGGMIVGIWFTFGSWRIFYDLALLKLFAGPSTVMTTAVVFHLQLPS